MLALLVFAVIDAVPARAQTSITLVSNTGQTGSAIASGLNRDYAVGFTTGANVAGYTLTQVDIPFADVRPAQVAFSVSIRSSSAGSPGASLGALTLDGTLSVGTNSFAASGGGIALAANTTYFLVIDVTTVNGNTQPFRTNSNDEDSGGEADWSIANVLLWRAFANTGSWGTFNNETLRFAVYGYKKTPPRPPTPPPVIKSPQGVRVGNPDDSLPITLKKGDSIPLTPLGEGGDFLYRERTIDLPVTRDECTYPGNPAVILSKEILDRVYDRSQEIAFELSGTSPQDPPHGFRMEGCILEIDPGVRLRTTETVTVCLPPAGIQGKSYIHRYNDESGEWEPLPLETVDDDELLCGETDTFSPFRVFVPVVIGSEEVAYRGDPEDDVFPLTPVGEGGSMGYGQRTIDLSVTGDTDPSYGNPAVIVSREILDRVSEITFRLSEVSPHDPPPGYRLQGFEAEVNLGVTLRQGETVSVCLPYSGGEEDIYYRYNEELGEWEELLESQLPDTVNGEDVLCGDAGAVSLSGVFVEETGGCVCCRRGWGRSPLAGSRV